MNWTSLRLALRLHRFEILILGGLAILGVALTLLVCSWLDGTGYGAACMQQVMDGHEMTAACMAAGEAFNSVQSSPILNLTQLLLVGVPFLLSALGGVALVGRELERGTARLAWSLAPSRLAWFVGRLLPLLFAVAIVALAAGLALDRMTASMQPGLNPWAAMFNFSNRGVDFAARAVFAFAVAVLVGAWLGRALPALLVTVVVVFIGLSGGSVVYGRILASEAIVVADTNWDPANETYDSGYLAPDGRFIGWEEAQAMFPQQMGGPTGGGPNTTDSEPPLQQASRVVLGSSYPFVVAREVAALLGGAAVALGLALLQVRRARPG